MIDFLGSDVHGMRAFGGFKGNYYECIRMLTNH